MKEVEYENLVKDSWVSLRKNPVLLVPGIIMFFLSMLFVLFYISVSGIMDMIVNNPGILFNKSMFESSLSILLLDNPLRTFISSIIYALLVVLSDAFFITIKYGMIKEVIKGKKPSLKEGMLFGIKNYISLLGASVVSMVILLVPLLLAALLVYKMIISTGFYMSLTGFLIIIFITIIGLVYAVYIVFRLLYLFPVMFIEEKGPFESVKKDFHYVKANITHTLMSWLIVLGVLVAYSIIRNPMKIIGSSTANIFILAAIYFLVFFIENIISIWNHLFIFKSYIKGKRR